MVSKERIVSVIVKHQLMQLQKAFGDIWDIVFSIPFYLVATKYDELDKEGETEVLQISTHIFHLVLNELIEAFENFLENKSKELGISKGAFFLDEAQIKDLLSKFPLE